jgi:hypothetical protein
MQSNRYCFTWNNPDDGVIPALEQFHELYCNYMVLGKEVGDSGTPHLQGFMHLKKRLRITGLRKLGIKCHLEQAKGTSQQAADYCKKEGDFVEFGELRSEQGKRNDIHSAIADLKDGTPMKTIAEDHSAVFVKFGRGLRDLALTLSSSYDHDSTRGLWIYGPPGTGKSHAARAIDPDAYLKAQNKWFDGYNGEHTIILDDLDTNVLGHHLKIWSDKYACTGETKGGTTPLQHRLFIITSNYHPDDLWKEDQQMLEALKRRFTIIKKTSKNQLIDHVRPTGAVRASEPEHNLTY